ncbi:MAG TPA: hypothetical protein VJK30_03650 [Coxiellaceae bacterium]|nr:MAG: hypothetical protein A3E81_07110 [Gammaproteobacteria bacterium RIFCSPHIGHO2_12_FULL_36_30]HLB56405.1 hypothetical protein [Coxiellaceae bacterium]
MKLKLLFITFIIFPLIISATEKFPTHCRISGLRFSHHSILFFSQHTAMPRLYVIKNISKKIIWLTHEKKNPGASAGWDTQLSPQHWSAILITRRQFDLHCHFQNKAGVMMRASCEHMIRACQFSEFYSHHPIGGSYWVVENVLFRDLMSRIRARGFSLK